MKPLRFLFSFSLWSIVLCLTSGISNAQSGTWVWMNGSNALNSSGNYGIQGVPSVNNSPPGLYNAAQWTDKRGNFWIFGGLDYRSNLRSDLWEYNPLTNSWAWVNGLGAGNLPGVYGTLGIPSPNNIPGARGYGCSTWVDTTGDLWLFGGAGYDSTAGYRGFGLLNDLWRYHIANNEWTWMGGTDTVNNPGNYGNMYMASDTSLPPSRQEINTAWIDSNNNLWLFGGLRYANGPSDGSFGDMWRYSSANGQWTWMGGSQQVNSSGSYGVLGVESTNNLPHARCSYTHWVDSNYLYLTGGVYFDSTYLFNDVWRFNLNTNYWTWVGGDSGSSVNGNYSHYCSSREGEKPRGRFEQRSTQLSGCLPSFFMWGGSWATNIHNGGVLNDLWSFNMSTKEWRWISGSDSISPTGNYGTIRVSASTNMPPGAEGACLWTDNSGNLWLWGGEGYSRGPTFCNALWKYTPDPTCFPGDTASSNLSFQLSVNSICAGDSAIITITGDSAISISPGNQVTWIDVTHAILMPDTTTVFAISGYASCSKRDVVLFTLPVVTRPTINLLANRTLICSGDSTQICAVSGFTSYKWTTGDTSACISAQFTGYYNVTVSENGTCSAASVPVALRVLSSSLNYTLSDTTICAGDSVFINFVSDSGTTISPDTNVTWIDSLHAFLKPSITTGYNIAGYSACGRFDSAHFVIKIKQAAVQISTSKTEICPGDTTRICAPAGFTRYSWSNSDTTACIKATSAGNYYVTVSESGNCSVESNHIHIDVYTALSVNISVNGDTLRSNGANSYQWFLNQNPIPNATDSTYIAKAGGAYSVQVTDSNGCKAVSNAVIISGIVDIAENMIELFPNPASDIVTISYVLNDWSNREVSLQISNALGQKVYLQTLPMYSGYQKIDVSEFAAGLYNVAIVRNGGIVWAGKFVKE